MERAVVLVAEDRLIDEQIAAECGISRRTLLIWKKRATFAARVQKHRDQLAREIQRIAITDRTARLKAINNRWERMQRIAEDHLGKVETAYAKGSMDTDLLRELREHEKQASQELGQFGVMDSGEGEDVLGLEETLVLYRRAVMRRQGK